MLSFLRHSRFLQMSMRRLRSLNVSNSLGSTVRPSDSIHSYLLGESVKNVILRLTLILTAIVVIWACMIAVSVIRSRYQRRRQTFRSSHNLHHLAFESTTKNLMSNQRKQVCRFDSSSTTMTMRKGNVLGRILPSIKRPAGHRSVVKQVHPPSDPAKIHAVIEAMTRRSFTSSHRGSLEKSQLPDGEGHRPEHGPQLSNTQTVSLSRR